MSLLQLQLPTMAPLLIYILLPALGLWFIFGRSKTPTTPNVPHIQFDGDNSPARYQNEMSDLLAKGYEEYHKKGLPFSVRNPFDSKRPMIVLPFKYYEELKWAPERSLSFWDYIDKQADLSQVGIPLLTHEAALAARVGLNRALGSKIAALNDACITAFEKNMPDCLEWTAVVLYPVIMEVFANMSACVFVGPEVGKLGSEWQRLTLGYVNKTNATLMRVRGMYPRSLLWLSRYLDGGVRSMMKDRRDAGELLRSSLEARLAVADGPSRRERGTREFEDGVQWLVDVYRDRGKEEVTPDMIQQKLITIVFSSIHGTSAVALTLLFDMMKYPETLDEIRKEIATVRGANLSWTRQALGELRLLDSFMRESTRVRGASQLLSMQRIAQTTWTFNDGFSLPAGSFMALPGYHRGLDADVHPSPEVFDARRHLRKRETTDKHRYHFGSASDDMLPWGGGTHACPGRFFAQESLKLIFVYLLTGYDFKLSEEHEKMPKLAVRNLMMMPNMGIPILFKERRLMK